MSAVGCRVVALALVLGASAPAMARPAGPTSLSKRPGGTKVLYLLLADLGYRPRRVFTREGLEPFGVAVALGPQLRRDARRLARWVRGGRLLIFAPPLADERGICKGVELGELKIERKFRFDKERTTKAEAADLRLGANPCVITAPAGGRVLARTDDGAVVLERQLGRGWVLLLAHAELLTNGKLDRDDIAVLLRRWLARRAERGARVAFVERRRGGQLWQLLERANLLPFLGHGLLLLLLIYWRVTPRFGDADAFEPAQRRAFSEHARALGTLWRRAGGSAHALGQIYERARGRLRQGGGRGQQRTLAASIAARSGRDADEVQQLLGAVQQVTARADGGGGDPQRDLRLARQLAALLGPGRAGAAAESKRRAGDDETRDGNTRRMT